MSSIHIIISGASSVGKTTLVNRCLKSFHEDRKLKTVPFKQIDEVARTVLKRLNITGKELTEFIKRRNVNEFSQVQEQIIHEQIKAFDQQKDDNYLSDRSGFDALAYIDSYFPNTSNAETIFQSSIFKQLINQCRNGFIFLVQPQEDLQAQNDQMRMIPSYEEQILYTNSLKYWFKKAKLSYFVITDLDLNKRVEFIRKHLDGYFQFLPNEFPIPLNIPFHLNKSKSNVDRFYIRFIEIIDEENLKISYKNYDPNRFIEKYDPSCLNNKFASIKFDKELNSDFVGQILLNGIGLNDQTYHFLGCSSSKLKERSCYLYADSFQQIDKLIEENGDFNQIKSISKRIARIGLLFTSCTPTIDIPSDHIIHIDDIERNGFIFTDGCGIITRKLAQQIVPFLPDFHKPILSLNDNDQSQTYPCAFQIRYQGCKGMLMINNDDLNELIEIRPSMKKFNGRISTCLYVCENGYSKPKLGFINKQFLMILSGLNIPDEILLKKQNEHFQEIRLICEETNIAMKYCLYDDRIDLFDHLLSNNIQSIQSELQIIQKKALDTVEKLKIPITKSRLAFGVCDPYGILKPGEVYFRPTFNGRQFAFDSKICFIAKSPSYHLGDIQVFKLTSCKQLEYLYDVIVFPTKGNRPHPNEIAGSDLDGDQYLICWDNDLIPKKVNPPMDYSSTVKSQELISITREDVIKHFANAQSNNQSGLIDSYFNYWANRLGVCSTQCRRLAQLFSAAVDAPKTGQRISIPSELRSQRNEQQTIHQNEQFIWIRMLKNAKEFREDFQRKLLNENQFPCLSKESLLNLFYHRRCPNQFHSHHIQSLNEYQLIISTIRWANEQDNPQHILKDFIYLFDTSQLTMEQKQNIELSLRIDQKDLYSILNKSRILSNELIDKYHFNETSLSWRLFYTSPKFFQIESQFEFEQIFEPIIYVFQQNSNHQRILINISIDQTITLVFDIYQNALVLTDDQPKNNQREITYQIQSGLFNVYLESKLYSIRRKCLLDLDYFIKIRDDRIQIYEKNEGNSFIVLMYDEQKRISVDLTRFDKNILRARNHPKINKHHFNYFEIFVLSNDQQIQSSYYPIISFYDEEYFTQNYFHQQIEHYQFTEFLTEQEKVEEENYKKEQEEYEKRREQLKVLCENISEENVEQLIEESMSIHQTEYLYKIWKYCNEIPREMNQFNEKLINYFIEAIQMMLKGSTFRPFIDEQFFYQLLVSITIEQKNVKYFNQISQLMKKLNSKLKDKSYPSYIPHLGRILQRLIKEYFQQIEEIFPINQEFLYHLLLSLILSNNYNTDDLDYNYFVEIHSQCSIELTFKQICHLIQSCLMSKDSEICLKFIQYLSNIPKEKNEEIDYIIEFLSIIIRSAVYDIEDMNKRIRLKRDILIKNGETIFDLRAKFLIKKSIDDENDEQSPSDPIFTFEHYQYEKIPSHHLNIGDSVALIDQDEFSNNSNEKLPLRFFYQSFGTVLSVYPSLTIQFLFYPLSLTNRNYLNKQKLFRLERLPNFVTLNRSIDAFRIILDNNISLPIKPFLNLSENLPIEQLRNNAQQRIQLLQNCLDDDCEYERANLNDSQRQAIRNALQNRLTLIQGPPGTGKTETSAWIIHLCVKYFLKEGQTILVCAETHQAVDNLTRRLLRYKHRLVRYGETRSIAADLHEYTMAKQIELLRREKQKLNPDKTKKSLFGFAKSKEIREILSKSEILCMTCSGVGILEPSLRFPFILIDEASQITEPNILISLVRITDQIVLVGDQKQLPPIIKMTEAKPLLERSFFQRLLENLRINSIMLDTQYRMHPALIDFPSKYFYQGLLKSGVTVEQRTKSLTIQFVDQRIPLMFVDVKEGLERIHGANIFNKEEVKFVLKTIQLLLPQQKATLSPNEIGVITPYTRQVKEISDQLSDNGIAKGVEVRTVDGFQGREKDIILISLVRANDQNEIGFLENPQRMNVLLTRAKYSMIVFGNKQTLISNHLWKSWIDNVPNIDGQLFLNQCLTKQNPIIPNQSQSNNRRRTHGNNSQPNNNRRGHHH